MNAFTLKMIAIIAMTLNHIAHVFGSSMPDLLYYIFMGAGGLTFPIMAYLMSEGYKYTHNFKKYAMRLFLFALLALIPFGIAMGTMLNVLFTLLFGLMIIYSYDHTKSRIGFTVIFIFVTLFTIFCDWSLMGVPMILCYHVIKNKYARLVVPVLITWFFMGGMVLLNLMVSGGGMDTREMIANLLFVFGGCSATIPLLLHYNGERGPSMKYIFYAYYPAHLTILAILAKIIY